MTDSRGSRSNSARATVSPPIPESNTPSGALFMERNADADAAGKRADLEIGWEVVQMRGNVGLRAREEMIEDPEHQPVLHFLPLVPEIRGVNRLEVVRLLLRLHLHHYRHAFPRDECRAGDGPVGGNLAPAGKHEGPQEGSHRAHAVVHGIWRESQGCILRYKSARRHDCKQTRKSD